LLYGVEYESLATCRVAGRKNQQMSAQFYILLLLAFLILKVKISQGKLELLLSHLLRSP